MQLEAIPLINALFCEVNPIPVKARMNLMGKEVGPLRMPLTEMEPEHQEILKKAMKEYGHSGIKAFEKRPWVHAKVRLSKERIPQKIGSILSCTGCNGAMGRVISAMAQEMDGIRIAAGVDLNTGKKL